MQMNDQDMDANELPIFGELIWLNSKRKPTFILTPCSHTTENSQFKFKEFKFGKNENCEVVISKPGISDVQFALRYLPSSDNQGKND